MRSVLQLFTISALLMRVPLGGAPRQHVLDLTRPDLVVTSPAVTTGGGGAVSGQTRLDLPLELRLARLDRSVYVLGHSVKYEMVVKNAGEAPFSFPWSTDRELIEREGESFSQVTLALRARDTAGREYLLASVILDGSAKVAGSIETLMAGEEAVIKAEKPINLPSDAAESIASAGPVEIKAALTMKTVPTTTWWNPVLSSNKLDLLFKLPSR